MIDYYVNVYINNCLITYNSPQKLHLNSLPIKDDTKLYWKVFFIGKNLVLLFFCYNFFVIILMYLQSNLIQ